MQIHFSTSEHDDVCLDGSHYPVPAKGTLVEWTMDVRSANPIPHGRYRVEEVVWRYGLGTSVVVFLAPAR